MRVDKLNLERVFERTERLEAPLFQRPYVWEQERNWEPLWASIQMVAERRLENKPVHPHFLGTVVLDQLKTGLGKIHVRHIIDGQQRLTTLQLALAASRDLCSRLNEGRYAKAFEKLTINEVPLSDNPDDVFKVWPTNADREDFRAVLKAGSPAAVRKIEHAGSDDEWLIPNAYLYFHDRIGEWLGPAGTAEFRSRLDVLYITMRDDIHLGGHYDVLITMDRGIEFQQPISTFPFGVIIAHAASNRLQHLRPLVPAILAAIASTTPGQIQRVGA